MNGLLTLLKWLKEKEVSDMKKGTVSFEKAVTNFDEFTTNIIIASGLLTLMKWLKEQRGD